MGQEELETAEQLSALAKKYDETVRYFRQDSRNSELRTTDDYETEDTRGLQMFRIPTKAGIAFHKDMTYN